MDFHGITMKGKYFMEEESAPTSGSAHEKRIAYNTSSTVNGSTDQYGQNKMFYHNDSQWVRPLLGNINDGPDVDDTRILGSSSYRFKEIHATDLYTSTELGFFRNHLINANFDIWQRATSQTSSGYDSDDRWVNEHSGSSKTHSRQSFTVGQTTVPNNPKYFSRTVVTTGGGNNDYVVKQQRIEDISLMSGETVTLSFWAKADANRSMAMEFQQDFGTGGSPSSDVTAIGVNSFSLTTSWQQFNATVSIPSISGKTLGSNNDDYLRLNFWFDAGSNLNSHTNSLGNQSGTFDIAQIQLERGRIVTQFERRPLGTERSLCFRYYERVQTAFRGDVTNGQTYGVPLFYVYKRSGAPSINWISDGALANFPAGGGTATEKTRTNCLVYNTANGTSSDSYWVSTYEVDTEL